MKTFRPASPRSRAPRIGAQLSPRLACLALAVLAATATSAADLLWVGGSGDWTAAKNWSPAQVPGPGDNVAITGSGTYTVTLPAKAAATVNSLTLGGSSGTQTVALDRATLTFNGPSVIRGNGRLELLVSQSLVTGPGSLSVEGKLHCINGTLAGPGVANIQSAGILEVGSAGVTLARTVNCEGLIRWSGGRLNFSPGTAVNTLSGGLFEITADGHLSGDASTPINNAGVQRHSPGALGTLLLAPVNSSGRIEVLSGTLSLGLGGSQSGTLITSAGAALDLSDGDHLLGSLSVVTDGSTLSVSGGATTVLASGTFNPNSNLRVTAGAMTLGSGCNVAKAHLNIDGGLLGFDTASTVDTLHISGGILGGSSRVVVTGALTLSGGSVQNSLVTANGGLNIDGGVTLDGGTLVNTATALWSAGRFTGANGAVFSNALGASFINTFDGNAASGAGTIPRFINAGLFAKTNGTAAQGATSIDFEFINTGTVNIQTNTLRYGINEQSAGVTVLNGGGLAAQAQPLQFLGGDLVGNGRIGLANLQTLVNSASISPGFPLGGMDISGNYEQTESGVLNIDLGGTVPGSSFDRITVTSGGAGGTASLGGTLNVGLTNGFTPKKGDTFTFLTALSRVGIFTRFNYPSNDVGMELSYEAASVKLTVSNLRPTVAHPIIDPASIDYGSSIGFQIPADTFADPDGDTLSYSADGLPPGLIFSPDTRAFSGSPTEVGSFVMQVTARDGGTPSLSVTSRFTLTVRPAALVVRAQPATKPYGSTDPAFTATYSGFVNNETPAVLGGTLSFTRPAGESAGIHPTTPGGLSSPHYTLTYQASELTITRVGLIVTAVNKTKIYGETDPTFSVSYSGFVNEEGPAALGGVLGFDRATGEEVGAHIITPRGLTSGNYEIQFKPGTLTIVAPAPTLLPLSTLGGGQILVRWSAAAGASYRVQYKDTLDGSDWADLPGDVTASANVATRTDTTPATHRFYRVQLLP